MMRFRLNISLLFLVLSMVLVMSACSRSIDDKRNEALVKKYIGSLNTDAEAAVLACVSDSIRLVDLSYTVVDNKDELITFFKWDSVFQPTYKILSIKSSFSSTYIHLSKDDDRIGFLQDSALISLVKFDFEDHKISYVDIYEYQNCDFDLWEKRLYALQQWVAIHHPVLKGFATDLTLVGAQKYRQAIQLYEQAMVDSLMIE